MGTATIGTGATAGQQVYKNYELAYGIGNQEVVCTIGGQQFIPTSLPVQVGGDLKEYKNNVGQTCSLVVPENFQTISISGYLIKGGSGTAPKKGDEVKNLPTVQGMMQGVTWRLQDLTTNWQNEDVANISISVKSYSF